MTTIPLDLAEFTARAGEVAEVLKALASRPRLMVLCKLVECGEIRVGELADEVGLSQSALSQHLARMREEGLVAFRRDGQQLFYRIDDPRCEALLVTLHRLYCPEET
jgi:DNA-binding transcriptional ArsR family regulator